ncbi:hypothetical protein SKAU_G00114320 [Synaphobranchus kaupii]|uniref:Uncharacterized protein n=1 Tax=Synaphobranchus kaupii TaxID=118154 RepID=A0A9Q1J8D1_SYNKA|nr:hypothetical protein SKAU_G00114320 [Synaphobranchus kaupii]
MRGQRSEAPEYRRRGDLSRRRASGQRRKPAGGGEARFWRFRRTGEGAEKAKQLHYRQSRFLLPAAAITSPEHSLNNLDILYHIPPLNHQTCVHASSRRQ